MNNILQEMESLKLELRVREREISDSTQTINSLEDKLKKFNLTVADIQKSNDTYKRLVDVANGDIETMKKELAGKRQMEIVSTFVQCTQ